MSDNKDTNLNQELSQRVHPKASQSNQSFGDFLQSLSGDVTRADNEFALKWNFLDRDGWAFLKKTCRHVDSSKKHHWLRKSLNNDYYTLEGLLSWMLIWALLSVYKLKTLNLIKVVHHRHFKDTDTELITMKATRKGYQFKQYLKQHSLRKANVHTYLDFLSTYETGSPVDKQQVIDTIRRLYTYEKRLGEKAERLTEEEEEDE